MIQQEKSIECFDCGAAFIFTVDEQLACQAICHFNAPKRCPSCRLARKACQMKNGNFRSPQPGFQSERRLFHAVCSQCGRNTEVPFEPKPDRPVYCRECYQNLKVNR